MSADLLTVLAEIPDPRRREGKIYPLASVLLFTILGMLAGAHSYRRIHSFIKIHLQRLNAAFPAACLSKAPAYSSIRNIIHGVDAAAVENAFRSQAAEVHGSVLTVGPEVIALDGKTLRGSFDAFADRKAAHVLGAFAVRSRLVLAHVGVPEKSNEIPAAQALIEDLGLKGQLFTADAMHCQKKTFEVAKNTGNDLLVQVKENQPKLHDLLQDLTKQQPPIDQSFSRDKGRNRVDERWVEVFPLQDAVAGTEWAPFLATAMRVTRQSWLFDTSSWKWNLREETSFYVASIAGLPATYFAAAIRNHWGIENRNHHVRDVSLFEDQSRIRSNPSIMARIRSFALNILRFNNVTNVANTLWENALCFERLCATKGI